ncbi:leucine-rich repeat domain-containing protein [Thiothrix fructosivorans]|uniref:non-specific serine/threonine protein kinase n=2 Tax=Thiothrix fructosivorans TaxID=111770 RepID=A0A8B0SRU4_9GAMM|nr:leucine-rich repeat domain-containing protein [Thiothrix fructosivorans]QTX12738.1 leucine-rich repeat domain-containing protein [Thiothrix fructosivorans]
MPTPLEIALERIEECRRTRSTELDLSCLGLDEIPEEVFELTWLEKLNVLEEWDTRDEYGEIKEIPLAIKKLKNLTEFNCATNQISDLSPLCGLPALQTLDCRYNQISRLTLNGLPALQFLFCTGNKISDLFPFSGLSTLQALDCGDNNICDLSPLSGLTTLQWLCFSHNHVSDLSPLSALFQLRLLDCSNTKISNLSPLSGLSALKSLDCSNNQINHLESIYNLVMSENLKYLKAYGNPVYGIPSWIFRNFWVADNLWDDDNCLENIRNYWQDLDKGSERQQQLKVQLVGNGRVGKTTLAYALEHKRTPSEQFKSTHGIVINEIQQTLDGEEKPVILQLWDFGGQEIYHTTHRLFLSDDCLYLLLWAEETEEHPDETRHPVSYWLELIHDLGNNSPVILVKNQIDRADRLPTRPAGLSDDMPGVQQIRQEVKISAMQYRGMPALRGAIESVLEELKQKICLELPTSWLQVQRELKQLDQKSIPLPHFKQLCIKAGISHAEWLANYLHKTGALFYSEGTFQDQIILDQNWAINAVYRVFDPNKPHRRRIERMGGRFIGEDASLLWADAEAKEQEVYVDFMRNCGICYETKQLQNLLDNKPFAEREFIIPALLPLISKAKTAWGNSRPDDWQLDIEYPFLHRSIIERMILRIGETYEGEPWRTGIFCETDEGQLLLECEYANKQQSTQGRLHFQLRSSQPERLVYALRKLVRQTSPHRRYQEYLSKAGAERTLLPEFKDEAMQHPSKLDASKPADKTIKLFISYSHADEAHKERLEKHLKAINRTLPLTAWSDRHLFAGEPVDEQIFQQLNTADIVLLLVSPDFINSDYCFTKEMERALERYQDEGNVVIPVIIRHTASWRNHKIGQIVALPKDGKPLAKWDDADEFWGSVEEGIRDQVKKRLQA